MTEAGPGSAAGSPDGKMRNTGECGHLSVSEREEGGLVRFREGRGRVFMLERHLLSRLRGGPPLTHSGLGCADTEMPEGASRVRGSWVRGSS